MNSANQKTESILEGKAPECSKKQNLNLLRDGNYLHIIYITRGIISNLETIYHIWEVVCRLEVGTRLSSSIFTKLSLCRMEPRWERKGAVGCGLWLASPRCGVPSSTPRSPGTLNADPAFQVTILY